MKPFVSSSFFPIDSPHVLLVKKRIGEFSGKNYFCSFAIFLCFHHLVICLWESFIKRKETLLFYIWDQVVVHCNTLWCLFQPPAICLQYRDHCCSDNIAAHIQLRLAIQYTIHCTLFTVHYKVSTVHCTLYTVHCTLHPVDFTL